MEQNTFTNTSAEKLQIPEVNFSNDVNKDVLGKEDKREGGLEESHFTPRHYAVAAFFIVLIILFVFFINGMSVYKSDSFIN